MLARAMTQWKGWRYTFHLHNSSAPPLEFPSSPSPSTTSNHWLRACNDWINDSECSAGWMWPGQWHSHPDRGPYSNRLCRDFLQHWQTEGDKHIATKSERSESTQKEDPMLGFVFREWSGFISHFRSGIYSSKNLKLGTISPLHSFS